MTASGVPNDLVASRYRLHKVIGEGGMGRVYRATDDTLTRTVAVKILLPQYAVQEQSRKRFIREAKVTATLSHPAAIRIYDFGVEGNILYLVMELLEGRTLRSLLTERAQLPPEEALAVAGVVADVLVASHQLPLIHRDLKPENIMLRGESVSDVVVLDFGMAFIDESEDADSKGMGRLTKEGLAGGTPTYMSPEQVQGAKVTGAADVYALGCILFEMLAGEPPFDGPMMKVLTKQMYQPAPDVRRFCPEAPQALVELVERMLAKRPADRPSAETVRKRIEALGPATSGARERSRDDSFLRTREARMISAPIIVRTEVEETQPTLSVALVGELEDGLSLALAASGISVLENAGTEEAHDVIFVASPEGMELSEFCAQAAAPVVVVCGSVAIEDVSELLRAGVAEIVTRPISPDELTKKLRRAARKKR